MHCKLLATAALAANLLFFPAFADTVLPPLQPASPVFEEYTKAKRPAACDEITEYGNAIEQTVKLAVVEPLVSIATDLARLFRPFFVGSEKEQESSRMASRIRTPKRQSPSNMVRMAARKRLCG